MKYIGLFLGTVLFTIFVIWLPMALVNEYYSNQFYNEYEIKKIDNKRKKKIERILTICFIIYLSAILFFIMQK